MSRPARPPVAILGAGMAGATAARHLASAGLPVRVLDKGRGVGGRMATRRGPSPGLAFDHGAQVMRAHGPAFAAQLAEWERRGVTAAWGGSGGQVGVPGMTAPVRDLLSGLAVEVATTVTCLRRGAHGWVLDDAGGGTHGPFAAVAITVPAPQAVALLEAGGLSLPGLAAASYWPCWSLMVEAPGGPEDALVEPAEGPIALVAREATKPGRPPGDRFVVHAAPDRSREHLELPKEEAARALGLALGDLWGVALRPTHAVAHRWRYARVETALGRPCLYDPGLRLGAAGDWCLGPRVEAAYDSGRALAQAILADLGTAA